MDYIVKVNWLAEEIVTMGFKERLDAIAFLADIEDTLQRVSHATDNADGCAFYVTSRRQGDHIVGVRAYTGAATIVSYQLAGV